MRWKDPDTGRTVDERIQGNDDQRLAIAKQKSEELRTKRRAIEKGARPHVEAAMSIEDALKRYFQAHDLNPKALKVYRSAAADFQEWCDAHVSTVRQLNKARLFEFRTWLKTAPKRVPRKGGKKGEYQRSEEPPSPHSVNKALRAMSAILNVLRAADVVRLHSDEIKDALKRYRAETERRDFLRPPQIKQLLKETRKQPVGPLVRCMLLTGIRLEEALGIEWRDLEGDTLHIRAEIAKGGKRRDVDLSVAATAFGKRGKPDQRCFDFTFAEVRNIYEASKVGWTPHALRRTWSTFFTCCFGPWRASKSAGHGVAVLEANYAGLVKVPEGCKTLEEAMGL